jgi:ubiquinone/menaquinone biosynthesis C-methylase UbiE
VEAHEYQTLFEFEPSYWWYRGLHLILLDTVRSLGLGPNAAVLDAGCGTGQNLLNLTRQLTNNAYGFDFSRHAAAYWGRRCLEKACVASINEIPFPENTFEAVISVDVLECEAVNEDDACMEMWRVLRPGGYMILVVPAYDWMMNPEHHKAVGAVRRYSRSRLAALLKRRPVELLRVTHLFGSVFPAVATYRLADRILSHGANDEPRSDLKPLHPAINRLLFALVSAERRILRHVNLPFGSSIMAVARKMGSNGS